MGSLCLTLDSFATLTPKGDAVKAWPTLAGNGLVNPLSKMARGATLPGPHTRAYLAKKLNPKSRESSHESSSAELGQHDSRARFI